MLELAHSDLPGDPRGRRQKSQMASHWQVPLVPTPGGRYRQEKAMRRRIALRKSASRVDSSRGELSRNEIGRSMNFARSALGVRCVFASLLAVTVALSPVAS